MSNRRAEALVQAAAEQQVLADQIESHLDAYPMPVSDEEVDRVASRLYGKISPPRRKPWGLALAALSLAAVAFVALRLAVPPVALVARGPVYTSSPAAEAAVQAQVQHVHGPRALALDHRTLEVADGSQVLTSEQGVAAVALVQSGTARVEQILVPAGSWVVIRGDSAAAVVFPDGQAPPAALDAPEWRETNVREQLRDLRWRSLPVNTLQRLYAVTEQP